MSWSSLCVNVAIGKPASQSSLSEWSTDLGAGGAVTGVMPKKFGMHTDLEDGPWWMVDLGIQYAIDRIVIHNRLDMCFDRSSSLRCDISADGMFWRVVHAGMAYFLGGTVGPALVLPLGCRVTARYVRISLVERQILHLAQVEVFAHVGFRLKNRYGLHRLNLQGDYSTPESAESNRARLAYWIEGPAVTEVDQELAGAKITSFGRLGNQIIQIINATVLARRLGLKYVALPSHGLIELNAPFERHGVTYVSDVLEEVTGRFLCGEFFFPEPLSPVIDDAGGIERNQIVHEIIRPCLMRKFVESADVKHEDELTVHFRSGDIFADVNAAAGYTQPPLSFYTLIVRHVLREGSVKRVRLVFEDRRNPCIDRFIAFLSENGIPYRIQNGNLAEDLTALINSPNLVFGHGTFGVAVCMLSQRVNRLFFFQSLYYRYYEGIPAIGRTIFVRDAGGGYMKSGDWRGAPEQWKLMLEYPESALQIVA